MSHAIRYVGVIVPTGARSIVEGVANFAYPAHQWRVKWFSGWGGTDIVNDVFSSRFDGIIVCEDRRGLAAAISKGPWPVVIALDNFEDTTLPRVTIDNRQVAHVAAQYLLNKEFQHFLVCGTTDIAAYAARCAEFCKLVTAAGKSCEHWQREEYESEESQHLTAHILQGLSKPLAVFCESDWVAKQIADVCHRIALRVPEDVAILGVGNDGLICKLTCPPLSSVVTPEERVGYAAAKLLDRLMNGEASTGASLVFTPSGVMSRASTDALAVSDADVADALRFIRENAHKPIDVKSVLAAVPIGRRTLEKKFRMLLKRSPLDEIRRIRLDAAKLHLATSNLSISEIAELCGMPDARRFATIFKQHFHCSPQAFRNRVCLPDMRGSSVSTRKAGS